MRPLPSDGTGRDPQALFGRWHRSALIAGETAIGEGEGANAAHLEGLAARLAVSTLGNVVTVVDAHLFDAVRLVQGMDARHSQVTLWFFSALIFVDVSRVSNPSSNCDNIPFTASSW